jgi:hypothetical protein
MDAYLTCAGLILVRAVVLFVAGWVLFVVAVAKGSTLGLNMAVFIPVTFALPALILHVIFFLRWLQRRFILKTLKGVVSSPASTMKSFFLSRVFVRFACTN